MRKLIFPVAALAIFTAACTKEETTTTAQQTNNSKRVGAIYLQNYGGGGQMRTPYPTRDWECDAPAGNCLPDVIITKYQQAQLDAVVMKDVIALKQFLSDDATASQYFPDWNSHGFVTAKSGLLSGQYTLIKAGTATYLLGNVGEVSTENFEYAFPFKVK